jgi:hypothetical protein
MRLLRIATASDISVRMTILSQLRGKSNKRQEMAALILLPFRRSLTFVSGRAVWPLLADA